jgi:anti-sigma factor (TIGR02949 family)
MSEPRRIDCHEAARQLYEYLDRELTPATEAEVRAHLAACGHCFALFEFETAYLRFLEARARSQGAPEPVRRRIIDVLLHGRDDASA